MRVFCASGSVARAGHWPAARVASHGGPALDASVRRRASAHRRHHQQEARASGRRADPPRAPAAARRHCLSSGHQLPHASRLDLRPAVLRLDFGIGSLLRPEAPLWRPNIALFVVHRHTFFTATGSPLHTAVLTSLSHHCHPHRRSSHPVSSSASLLFCSALPPFRSAPAISSQSSLVSYFRMWLNICAFKLCTQQLSFTLCAS